MVLQGESSSGVVSLLFQLYHTIHLRSNCDVGFRNEIPHDVWPGILVLCATGSSHILFIYMYSICVPCFMPSLLLCRALSTSHSNQLYMSSCGERVFFCFPSAPCLEGALVGDGHPVS